MWCTIKCTLFGVFTCSFANKQKQKTNDYVKNTGNGLYKDNGFTQIDGVCIIESMPDFLVRWY